MAHTKHYTLCFVDVPQNKIKKNHPYPYVSIIISLIDLLFECREWTCTIL